MNRKVGKVSYSTILFLNVFNFCFKKLGCGLVQYWSGGSSYLPNKLLDVDRIGLIPKKLRTVPLYLWRKHERNVLSNVMYLFR